MDDKMADQIVLKEPRAFKYLPENFQTPARLIKALEADERDTIHLGKDDKHLLTEEVCKTYVRKNIETPEFPEAVWTPEFVEYCMSHGTSFRWFSRMPKQMQTREIVYKALKYSGHHLSEVRPELISLEQAQRLYRKTNITVNISRSVSLPNSGTKRDWKRHSSEARSPSPICGNSARTIPIASSGTPISVSVVNVVSATTPTRCLLRPVVPRRHSGR